MARKIALVGIGKIARDQHIPAIHADPDWDLAATVSRNASVGGIPNYTSLSEMLTGHPDVDTISLAVPPQPRFPYAAEAIAAGRHVMLEKPPGASVSECLTLAEKAKTAGVTLFATWHSQYAHGVEAARDWLSPRRVHSFRITWKEDVRRWHPGQEWIWQAGGLGVFDPGINALSILTRILPRPVHITASTLEFPENRETPIAAKLTFAGEGLRHGYADFDWRQEGPQTWTIEVETEDGFLKLSEGGAILTIQGETTQSGEDREYPNLYRRMTTLLDNQKSDVDLTPMIHVADAFTLAQRAQVKPFVF